MRIDVRGKQCPLPVIAAKNALKKAAEGEVVEILTDQEIALQNLVKMAEHRGFSYTTEKGTEGYLVKIQATGIEEGKLPTDTEKGQEPSIIKRKKLVVAVSADHMGEGDVVLGRLLMKGYLYALTQQEFLPETILFYNGGAALTCTGSESLEDLVFLEKEGVEILTCGTCLNYFGREQDLAVGRVTNLYELAERMGSAEILVKP